MVGHVLPQIDFSLPRLFSRESRARTYMLFGSDLRKENLRSLTRPPRLLAPLLLPHHRAAAALHTPLAYYLALRWLQGAAGWTEQEQMASHLYSSVTLSLASTTFKNLLISQTPCLFQVRVVAVERTPSLPVPLARSSLYTPWWRSSPCLPDESFLLEVDK